MCHLAGFARLAVGHVVEDILHGATVWEVALPHLTIGLFPALTLMGMQQENQLLLDQLPLLRVCSVGPRSHPLGYWIHQAWLLDRWSLLLTLQDKRVKRDLCSMCYTISKYELELFPSAPISL